MAGHEGHGYVTVTSGVSAAGTETVEFSFSLDACHLCSVQ